MTLTPPLPALAAREFTAERLVRFGHCDPAGIVYFPRYFEMLNGVVEDWWTHIGKPWTETVSKRNLGTPTAKLDTTFVAPSLLGETIQFQLVVERIGRSSLELKHRVVNKEGHEKVRFHQYLVATSLETHRSIPWPDDIRQAITQFKERT